MNHLIRAVKATIALGFVVVVGTGCSSTTSSPATGGKGEAGAPAGNGGVTATSKAPCQLLLVPDAETAVGEPLPRSAEDTVLGSCTLTSTDFTAGATITLATWDSLKMAATSNQGKPVAISGVGDEALNLNGSNGSILYVRKGTDGFLLSLNGAHIDPLADHGLAQEKVLAAKILALF